MKEKDGKGHGNTIIELVLSELGTDSKEAVYSEEKMIDEIGTFIFAGSETTTNLLTFALMILLDHPEALQKVRDEIKETIRSEADLNA